MCRLAPYVRLPLGRSRLEVATDTSRPSCEQPRLPDFYLLFTLHLAASSESYSCLSILTRIPPRLNSRTPYPYNNCLLGLASPQSATAYGPFIKTQLATTTSYTEPFVKALPRPPDSIGANIPKCATFANRLLRATRPSRARPVRASRRQRPPSQTQQSHRQHTRVLPAALAMRLKTKMI